MSAKCEELVEKYTTRAQEILNTVLGFIDDDSWKESKIDSEIAFYTRYEPSSSFAQVKSVVSIKAPNDVIQGLITPIVPVDKSTPKEQNLGFDFQRTIYEVPNDPESRCFVYMALPSPGMMISGRDFALFRRHFLFDGKREVDLMFSVDEDEISPPVNEYVRAKMTFQGFVSEPVGDEVKLTFFVHVDPAGKLPSWAYNLVATDQGNAALDIKKKALAKQNA